jgi:hypothetical protein
MKINDIVENIDYMAGHCHVMALALKQLHPDWKIRAYIGWEEESEDDEDYRIDHVYIVAPDGSAYDCRGKFKNEQELVGPDETGGAETQFVDYTIADIKNDIRRGELKKFTKDDILKALQFVKRININVNEILDKESAAKVYWSKENYMSVSNYRVSKEMKITEVVGAPIIAYHGTTDNISQFRPLTHFGTEQAARDRMDYKKNANGKVYKVQLDIRNPFTIKDFPGIHYDRVYAFELRDKKKLSQEDMAAITTLDDPAQLRAALLAKVKELGYDGFVYKNRYEDKGNISYVILDPSQVKVLEVILVGEVEENFADGKVKGKSRPGRVKRSGASCAGSVTDLRAKAKKYSGEKGKMYHWCANMKGGKK